MSILSGKQEQTARVSKDARRRTLDLLNELSDEELEEIAGGYQVTLTHITKPAGINPHIVDTKADLTGSVYQSH